MTIGIAIIRFRLAVGGASAETVTGEIGTTGGAEAGTAAAVPHRGQNFTPALNFSPQFEQNCVMNRKQARTAPPFCCRSDT
jgi:hypothetical protein